MNEQWVLGGPKAQKYAEAEKMRAEKQQFTAGNPVSKQEGPIADALNQISRQLDNLDAECGALESDINPILRHIDECLKNGPMPCEQPQSPLHEVLLAIYHRLEIIRQNFAEIRNRITL
jgi:hypothetical protein